MLQRALDQLRAGKINDVNSLHAALVPAVTNEAVSGHPADRLVPADVPWAVQMAVDSGNETEVAHCYFGPEDGEKIKPYAQRLVLDRKLDRALHDKFRAIEGDRLVKACGLETRVTGLFANVK